MCSGSTLNRRHVDDTKQHHDLVRAWCSATAAAARGVQPGLPHVLMLIERRVALISYQDYHMLLLTLAGVGGMKPPRSRHTTTAPTRSTCSMAALCERRRCPRTDGRPRERLFNTNKNFNLNTLPSILDADGFSGSLGLWVSRSLGLWVSGSLGPRVSRIGTGFGIPRPLPRSENDPLSLTPTSAGLSLPVPVP